MRKSLWIFAVVAFMQCAIAQQQIEVTVNNTINGTFTSEGAVTLNDGSTDIIDDEGSGASALTSHDTQHTAYTNQDRVEESSTEYKHHLWDASVNKFTLDYEFTTPASGVSHVVEADFTDIYDVYIFNNFEEFTDDGKVHFKDPWYVDIDDEQMGEYEDFDSPHMPTGAYGETGGAVFLDKTVGSSRPYYSMEFQSFLDYDYETVETPPLNSDDWVFIGAFARDAHDVDLTEEAQSSWWSNATGDWERDADYQVDIEFKAEEAGLFGFYKKHHCSSSEIAPTAINSQRKIAQEAETGDGAYARFHQVYESDGKIYYTWSEDDNSSWEGEILLSEFDHHCYHPMLDVSQKNTTLDYVIHVAFVDDTLDAVIVLSRAFDARPTDWTKVDEISISRPSACHPSLGTLAYDGHHFTFLAWEDGLNMKYSVFKDDEILTGDRVETTGTTSNVDFDGLTLTSVNVYSELKYPSVCRHSDTQYSYSDFGVVWSEQFSRSGPTKLLFNGLRMGKSGSTYIVSEADPIDAAGTRDIRYNTGASISIHPAFPRISYEYNSYSTYPAPSSGSSWPRVIAGRSFFAVTSQYPGYGISRQQYYSRVVAKNADDFCYEVASWPYVVHTMNIPSSNSDVRAPVIDHCWDANGNGNIKVVANWDLTAPFYTVWTYFDRWSWQSQAMQVLVTDGLYPQVSANNHDQNKGLSIFSDPQGAASPAGASSRVYGVDLEYEMHCTTTGIRKETGTVTTDEMREFTFTASDSAVVVYGVATPHYVLNDTTYSDVDWDMSYDTIPYLWWNRLRHGMKTESFTVPTGAEMEFGNELYAANAGDFAGSGGSFRIRIEFRDATEDTICYSEIIDMTNYSLDSSEYALDRIDISSLVGKTVFMCFNPIDSTSGCDFNVAYVVTPYYEETEKRVAEKDPVPDDIHLYQNFPNPFNPSTQIPYELKRNAHVTISVHDIFGRRIGTIQDGSRRAGVHVATFDATGLPSGIYLYRIEILGRTITKKMHFVK